MDIRGIIFACDGTLADTMPPHYEAWVETLARHGLTLDEDRFYAMGGWPTLKVARHLIAESGRPIDAEALSRDKEAAFERRIDEVRPIEPVVAAVREHRGVLPMAVATSGVRPVCERILDAIRLRDVFDTVVTCEDVTRHKPEPDVFLEAARRIGVAPASCLVYEDTDPGVEAARRAGMRCVDVRTLFTPRRVSA